MQYPLKANWLLALIGAVALPATAAANPGIGPLPLIATAVSALAQPGCGPAGLPAEGAPSKAASILGGKASALEQMQQQQGGALLSPAASALSGGNGGVDCQAFVAQGATHRAGRGNALLSSDDFLSSKRLPVSKTTFDAQWNRVRHAAVSSGAAAAAARQAPGRPTAAMLGAVNSWANQNIRYVADSALYGRADFWADAPTTLRRGAGDCEDIAIAKLSLLAAAGVPRQDMFLTIARDLARNADHAVLVVKLDGRFYLLDNNTDRLLDARDSHDYRPILSYSSERKWLHGY